MSAQAWCTVFAVFAGFLFLIGISGVFVVQPGDIGIVVTLGHVTTCKPGLNFRNPFISTLQTISSRTQLLQENSHTPTKEGLSVEIDTAVLFHLEEEKVGELYRKVGTGYISTIVEPETASAIRGLTSESQAKALYTSGRNMIQNAVRDMLVKKLEPEGIIVTDVLLKGIKLPDQLTSAIEQKAKAEQEAIRMQYVLLKEQKEAERKAIEAKGIADFQHIVSAGISPELLKWKGIEATEKFAGAQNTKIVMAGGDGKGMPLILKTDDE